MSKARKASGLLAGCLLLWGAAGPALAQPSVEQMLSYKPRQEGVACSTPTKEEQANCKVTLEKSTRPGASGWVLLDGQGRKLRRFFDSNGDKVIDIWSYYKDGVEVYRELSSRFDDHADQFRWLNAGGMKWGVDLNKDGRIDAWRMISAEEVAHEVFLATVARDFNRLKVLLITEPELASLKLPTAKVDAIRKQLAGAQAKFDDTVRKLPALQGANFKSVESGVPQCAPADTTGAERDLIKYKNRIVLYEGADKKHEWLSTGGMIQVGLTWRLLDAPVPGDGNIDPPPPPTEDIPELKALTELDKNPPAQNSAQDAQATAHYKKRVELLEQIITKSKDKENWIRQLADNCATIAQCSTIAADEAAAQKRLAQLLTQVPQGTPLASYVTFREAWARYAKKITTQHDGLQKAQEEWLGELTKFVQQHPKAEDAPDALMQLGMGREFGKEDEAKRWYQQLVNNFPEHPLTAKARGCLRRLELVGRPLELSAPTLDGKTYNITSSRNKVVVVYYWSKDCQACIGDFARLKQLLTTYSAKGLEVVGVSLDDTAKDAQQFLGSNPLPVPHMFQGEGQNGGMNGPLGTQYGIMTMPNIFLVGKDGNVISRTLQINDLEDAIKKAL
jgi:peroxiredoxin